MFKQAGVMLALAVSACSAFADISAIVAKLDSPEWADREQAERDLVELGPPALDDLRAALAAAADVEVRARLESAIARIERDQATGPSRITLDVQGAPLADVLAEINRQARSDITLMNPEFWAGQQPGPVTLKLENASFWQAIDALQQAANVGITITPEGWQVMRNWGGGGEGITAEAGVIQIAATNIHYSRSRVFGRNGRQQSESFQIQLALRVEPKINLTSSDSFLELTRAVDDRGNDLLNASRLIPIFDGGVGQIFAGLPLKYPADPGQTISEITGTVRLAVAVDSQSIDVADALSFRPIELNVASAAIRVEPAGADPGQPNSVRIRVRVVGGENESIMRRVQQAAQRARVTDSQDRRLRMGNSDTRRIDQNQIEFNFTWVATNAQEFAGPVRVHMEIPTQTQVIQEQFTLRDLPYP